MRTVTDIYKEYRTPPWLQIHQLRVAAVGAFIAEHYNGTINQHDVIGACLLHDIGAIVKFDFNSKNPDLAALYNPDDTERWLQVQKDFRTRYGEKEHPATDAILRELHISDAVQEIVHSTGFQNMQAVIARGFIEAQVVQYADMRVGLGGITSLHDRLADVKKRYAKPDIDWNKRMDDNLAIALDIEERLFEGSSVHPSEVTNETADPIIEELRRYEI